jgi:hypothetical protein
MAETSEVIALGCSTARPCALIRDAAKELRYIEFDSENDLRAIREQRISLPESLAYGRLGATLSEQDLALVSVQWAGAHAALWATNGTLEWVTPLAGHPRSWRLIQTLGDQVAVLVDDVYMPLRLLNRGDGRVLREFFLSPQHGNWDAGCLKRIGNRLFAAWGRTDWGDSEDPTILETAWVDPGRDDVLFGAPQVLPAPATSIACEPFGDEIGVLVLRESGRVYFTRIDSSGASALPVRLLFRLTDGYGPYHFDHPTLLADGGLFAFSFRAEAHSTAEKLPRRGFVTFLTADGMRTRFAEVGPSADAIGLVGDGRSVAVLVQNGGVLAASRVHCEGLGRPSP